MQHRFGLFMPDIAPGLPSLRDEIEPFIVFPLRGGGGDWATWQIELGAKALALFLSQESAQAYCGKAGLGAEWKVFRPNRAAMLELLRTSRSAGIALAVLDPDTQKARRLFDINEILTAIDQL